MEIELQPEQLPEVEHAVAALLEEADPTPDPWWQAGLDEALGDP